MVVAMSTAPIGYGRPFTRADLERMPDDGRRYELIDGVLGAYQQVADAVGEKEFVATSPYQVSVNPAELVR
jgi:hypothetical protein